jgi:hypothetical protein
MPGSAAAPLPRAGEVFFDVRGDSRTMRLSWYAGTGVAVFSIWQGGNCTGTFRLPLADLPRMIETLRLGPASSGVPAPSEGYPRDPYSYSPGAHRPDAGGRGGRRYPEDPRPAGYPAGRAADYRPADNYSNAPADPGARAGYSDSVSRAAAGGTADDYRDDTNAVAYYQPAMAPGYSAPEDSWAVRKSDFPSAPAVEPAPMPARSWSADSADAIGNYSAADAPTGYVNVPAAEPFGQDRPPARPARQWPSGSRSQSG